MILKIFTIYDSKGELYLQPFYEQTVGQALRAFSDTCNEPDHPFYKHAEDFTLFELGAYDNTSAEFILHNTAHSLAKAIELKKEHSDANGDVTRLLTSSQR